MRGARDDTPLTPTGNPSVEYVTVDATEGGVVRLETSDGQAYALPARWLPAGAGEGDVLQVRCVRIAGSMELRLALDPAATARARRRVRGKLDQLRQRDEE